MALPGRGLIREFGDQFPPCDLGGRERAAILGPRIADVATPAERLEVAEVVGGASLTQRPDMVHFEPYGASAPPAAPSVAFEGLPPDAPPARGLEGGIVAAASPGHCLIVSKSL